MPSNSQRASVGSTYSSKKRASRKPSISSDSEASGAPAKKKIQSKDSDEESNQSESGEDKNSDPEEEEVFEVESIVDHRHRPGVSLASSFVIAPSNPPVLHGFFHARLVAIPNQVEKLWL